MVCYHASDKSDNAFARICTLAPNPETEVSDENKQGFLSRYLMRQLVTSIHQQAKASVWRMYPFQETWVS